MKIDFKKYFNFDSKDTKQNLKNQRIVTYGIITLFVFILIILINISESQQKVKVKDVNYKNTINLSSSINLGVEEQWINKAENDLKIMTEQYEKVSKHLKEITEQFKEVKTTNAQAIDSLAIELSNIRFQQENNIGISSEEENYNSFEKITGLAVMENDLIQYNVVEENNNGYDLNDYLPAISYAPAIILMGTDASVGISAKADPNHIIFKITEPAIVAEYKGKQQTVDKIVGCRVHGSVIGDLSSEKAYVRLVKMQCSFVENRVVEFNVEGFASAVGKAGIRGPVISREGNLLWFAFWSGFIEGFSDLTSVAVAPGLELTSGIAIQEYSMKDALQQGASSGVGSAAGKLSDYAMDRAEQYQPIIAIQSGLKVELVFSKGVDLTKGNRGLKNNIKTLEEKETNNLIGNAYERDITRAKNNQVLLNNNGDF